MSDVSRYDEEHEIRFLVTPDDDGQGAVDQGRVADEQVSKLVMSTAHALYLEIHRKFGRPYAQPLAESSSARSVLIRMLKTYLTQARDAFPNELAGVGVVARDDGFSKEQDEQADACNEVAAGILAVKRQGDGHEYLRLPDDLPDRFAFWLDSVPQNVQDSQRMLVGWQIIDEDVAQLFVPCTDNAPGVQIEKGHKMPAVFDGTLPEEGLVRRPGDTLVIPMSVVRPDKLKSHPNVTFVRQATPLDFPATVQSNETVLYCARMAIRKGIEAIV